jgi:16S rRNA (guanine527-N7)-methyltransferase
VTNLEPRAECSAVAAVPPAAEALFGDRLELAVRYRDRLAGDGVVRGLIGPREAERLWERHLLNSAILTELLPAAARVVDVGSGAGLPGVPMAIRRPDLRVDLVEPMQRRTQFLSEVVDELGLAGAVRVVRGRADEAAVTRVAGDVDWVVARAVAPLDRLVRWCLPLLSPRGRLLALKGAGAAEEAAHHAGALRACGARVEAVEQLGGDVLGERTWVVVVARTARARAREA